jgi:prefoldin subunit 5
MLQKILGVAIILIGFSGMALGLFGVRIAQETMDGLNAAAQSSLTLAIDSLETVADSLSLANQTIADINTSLGTVQTAADNVAVALEDSQPMLTTVAAIAGEDLPESIASLQAAIPEAAQAAGAIDTTLNTLNRFRIDTSILGIPIQYDLGINYNPAVPFEQTVQAIGDSLDGLPDRLTDLEDSLLTTAVNLQTITADMQTLSTDLGGVSQRLNEFDPLIADYIRLTTEATANLRLLRGQIEDQAGAARNLITLIMLWLVLSQIVPLYLGADLLLNGRLRPHPQP